MYYCKTCNREVNPFYCFIDIYYNSDTFAEFFCDKDCHARYSIPVTNCGTMCYVSSAYETDDLYPNGGNWGRY